MLKLDDEQRATLADAVRQAAGIPALAEAIAAAYAEFEAERARRNPACDRSGRCCRFEAYGHRLFVTTVELAAFVDGVDRDGVSPADDWDGLGCPYQSGGLCTAHHARPFGCRVYFCDPTAAEWQQLQYERFHTAIRELHDRFAVPYVYAEWREALSAVGSTSRRSADVQGCRSLTVLKSDGVTLSARLRSF